MVRKNCNLFDATQIASRLKPGRHPCNCQARVHHLIRNCLNCGKIVCEQEGSGPCLYCGTFVCTKEEREILNKRDGAALKLLRKLCNKPALDNFDALDNSTSTTEIYSLSSVSETIQHANVYKQKLIQADKDHEITKVNDLQADYFTLELNPYLTQEERDGIVERKEQLRQLSLQAKRNILVDIDIEQTSAILTEKQEEPIESLNDPIIQSILTNSQAKNFFKIEQIEINKISDEPGFEGNLISEYKPEYKMGLNKSKINPNDVFDSIAQQENGSAIFNKKTCANLYYCIGLAQPLATDLANATINSIPWFEYIDYQGPVLIASIINNNNATATKCGTVLYRQMSDYADDESNEYPTQTILGRAVLRECISAEEFVREGYSDVGKFDLQQLSSSKGSHKTIMLIFEAQEELTAPIPYVCPGNFFKLDKQMMHTIVNTTVGTSGAGIFDCSSTTILM